jgi:MFS family permease
VILSGTGESALAPLRHRGFRLLAGGQFASNAGDACYAVALPWYVLAEHGGALLLGTVLVAYGIPRTALVTVGGNASDRWRPWTVMMTTDAARAVAACLGPARAVVLVPIAAVLGAGEGLFMPGSIAIIPALNPWPRTARRSTRGRFPEARVAEPRVLGPRALGRAALERQRRVPLPPGLGGTGGTVLIDGVWGATWTIARSGSRPTLVVEPFARLTPGQAAEVTAEGARLLAFAAPGGSAGEVHLAGPT